ncbi:hypothetical protein INQ25_04525 [Wolbachia endosymbiont of Rhagoletis cerasi]|nr:hypothetical protein [Wolbachia endosymbiont of Rhagoletis cerasi]
MQQSHPSVSYLDDKKGSTGMTGEGGYYRHKGTSVSYSDDTFFYLIWVMQEVYSRYRFR